MPKKKAKLSEKDKKAFVKDFRKYLIGSFANTPVYVTDNLPAKILIDQDILNAVKEEKQKIFTILNYILNKNSRPLSEGGKAIIT